MSEEGDKQELQNQVEGNQANNKEEVKIAAAGNKKKGKNKKNK